MTLVSSLLNFFRSSTFIIDHLQAYLLSPPYAPVSLSAVSLVLLHQAVFTALIIMDIELD